MDPFDRLSESVGLAPDGGFTESERDSPFDRFERSLRKRQPVPPKAPTAPADAAAAPDPRESSTGPVPNFTEEEPEPRPPAPPEAPALTPAQMLRHAAKLAEVRQDVFKNPNHPVFSIDREDMPGRIGRARQALLDRPDDPEGFPYHVLARQEYDEQKAMGLVPKLPPGSPKLLRQQALMLEAQQRFNDPAEEESRAGWWARNVGHAGYGFTPIILRSRANAAAERINAGSEDAGDYFQVAAAQKYFGREEEQGKTWKGTFQRLPFQLVKLGLEVWGGLAAQKAAAAALPGALGWMAGELPAAVLPRVALGTARGAALPALMPGTYVGGVERNVMEGRAALDPEGVAKHLVSSAVQMGVMGGVSGGAGEFAGAPLPRLTKEFTAAGVGTAAAAGLARDLTHALGLETGYGTLGHLARGEAGDALKEFTTDLLMGVIFHGLTRQGRPEPTPAPQPPGGCPARRPRGAPRPRVPVARPRAPRPRVAPRPPVPAPRPRAVRPPGSTWATCRPRC